MKRTKMTAERRERPTKLEELTLTTIQDVRHLSSHEVSCRREALQREAERLDAETLRLTTVLNEVKTGRARLEAIITGLTQVIDRR